MRRKFLSWLTATCVLVVLTRTPSHASDDESLDVIVHPRTPVTRLSAAELEALFTRTQTRWSDGTPVVPLSFPTGSPIREYFDRVVLRLEPAQVARFWLDRRIRGLGEPPKQAPKAAMMIKVVANLPGTIGYVPSLTSRAGVKVVARIVQGRVISP